MNLSPTWSFGIAQRAEAGLPGATKSARVKFYDFLDKQPAIGKLAIIEGTERVLADRALDTIVESVLPSDVRDLNLDRFAPGDLDDTSRLREAVQAMPFLAQSRLIVILDAQVLKTAIRRDIWS